MEQVNKMGDNEDPCKTVSKAMRVLWVACASLLATPALSWGSDLPTPGPNEFKLLGRIDSFDAVGRKVTLSVDSSLDGKGNELNFGTPSRKTVTVSVFTAIQWTEKDPRWLSIRDLKENAPVAAYVSGSPDAPEASRLLLIGRDPARPLTGEVFAPNSMGVEYDKVCMDPVTVPMLFPISGKVNWSDTFLASRGGGSRRHKGQDLMAAKLTPLIAVFDGKVILDTGNGNAGNTITLEGDNGWTAEYFHVNNDTPGTDDGKGSSDYAFAPGLKSGDRVCAGQFIGWVGDSGNAEGTGPHCHFEIWSQSLNACYNATPSLQSAPKLSAPHTYAAFPDLPVKRGQVRLDGVLRHLDLARSVAVLDVVYTATGDEKLSAVKSPTRRYVKVAQGSTIRILGMDRPVQMSDLIVGDKVTIVAAAAPAGQAVELAEAYALRTSPLASVASTSLPAGQGSVPEVKITLSGPEDQYLAGVAASMLEPINELRAGQGLPPLVFDQKAAQIAQTWAGKMVDLDFFDTKAPDGTHLAVLGEQARGKKCTALVNSGASPKAVAAEMLRNFPDIFLRKDAKSFSAGHAYMDDDPGRVNHQHYWAILVGD